MAVRVIARIKPPQQKELAKNVIVSTRTDSNKLSHPTEVKIPNPRNEREDFTFQFSHVYDYTATQQELFDNEG